MKTKIFAVLALALALVGGAYGQVVGGNALRGVTDGSNAAAGLKGEVIASTVTVASPIGLSNNVAANITSISLTAGDWDVAAIGGVTGAATTSLNFAKIGVSTTTGTLPANEETWTVSFVSGGSVVFNNETFLSGTIPPTRFSVSSTTTVFLVGKCNFTVSTCSGFGRVSARRVR